MTRSEPGDPSRPTFVALGASNVARALPLVVAGTRRRIAAGEPVDVLVATGRGRSYGAWAGLFGLARPAIRDCALWSDLERRRGPLDALVTDVGNDVLYGSDAAVIAGWVGACLERLAARAPRTLVLTGLPIERLREIGPREFRFWRRIFYPARRLAYDRVRATIEELHGRLEELARAHGAKWIVPPRAWYGLDPVHVPRRRFDAAWSTLLGPLGPGGEPARAWPRAALALRLARGRSRELRFLGRTWSAPQPSVRCADGSTVGLY